MRSNNNLKKPVPHNPAISYEKKPLRYYRGWWNTNSQSCYTEDEISLLKKIQALYRDTVGDHKDSNHFMTGVEKRWREMWECTQPVASTSGPQAETYDVPASFTLPNREAKDSKMYPLWQYSDNMARIIANWQSERVDDQNLELMNDPVMLVFDELRDWFFNTLSGKECKIEVLDDIAKRQSYLKNLIHMVPHFGPDRLRLHTIQQSLDIAARQLRDCVANKELPLLLSDLIVSGKNLESTLGTYLHFLMIDEPVADNFSQDKLEGTSIGCEKSPVCKIHQASLALPAPSDTNAELEQYQTLNRFYEMVIVQESDSNIEAMLQMRKNLINTVQFASFASQQDKQTYVKAIAAVEALANIRKALEKFNHIQSRVGTYAFAFNFLDTANTLAAHYIQLIEKTKNMIGDLIRSADNGQKKLLSTHDGDKQDKYFQQNLRSLETRYAKGTTVRLQLDQFCQRTIQSMNSYQAEMIKLAASVESGEAAREMDIALRDLIQHMNYLNKILPAILSESRITITKQPEISSSGEDKKIASGLSIEMNQTTVNVIDSNGDHLAFNSGKWNIEFDHESQTPVFDLKLYLDNELKGTLLFQGRLAEIKMDTETSEPIFVYSYGENGTEIATAEFYGSPSFCVTADKTRHNIIKTSGALSEFALDQHQLALETEICKSLPPTIMQKVLQAAGQSALHGVLRGGANVFGAKMAANEKNQHMISQAGYYGAVFVMKTGVYATEQSLTQMLADPVNTICQASVRAAIETGQLAFVSYGISMLGSLFDSAGEYCKNHQWHMLGDGLKKVGSLTRYGHFAYNTLKQDVSTPAKAAEAIGIAAASIAAGSAAQALTEKAAYQVVGRPRHA